MSQTDFDMSPWDAKVDKVFEDLSNARHASRRTLDINPEKFLSRAKVVSGCALPMSVVLTVLYGLFGNVITFGGWLASPVTISLLAIVIGSVASLCLLNSTRRWRFLNSLLAPLSGSLPISMCDVKVVGFWTSQHPQLVPILGKWMSNNPDLRLNLYDLIKAYRAVNKVTKIKKAAEKAWEEHEKKIQAYAAVNEELAALGITAVAQKQRLSEIVDASIDRSEEPPRAM